MLLWSCTGSCFPIRAHNFLLGAELDLDEAWGSETFSSSATLIREEMKDSASNAAASAAEKANDLKKVALTRKKVCLHPYQDNQTLLLF